MTTTTHPNNVFKSPQGNRAVTATATPAEWVAPRERPLQPGEFQRLSARMLTMCRQWQAECNIIAGQINDHNRAYSNQMMGIAALLCVLALIGLHLW